MSSLSDYKFKDVGLDQLLATSVPAMHGVTQATNILERFNISNNFYKTDQTTLGTGISNYSYQGNNLVQYLPKYIQYNGVQTDTTINIADYNHIGGFLIGGGGGGGGGGGANRDGDNHNGGDGGFGEYGQINEFYHNVATSNEMRIVTGNKGNGGGGGGSRENRSGYDGGHGNDGGDSYIQVRSNTNYGWVTIETASKGAGGEHGDGGSDNGHGSNGYHGDDNNWNSKYNSNSEGTFSNSSNLTRNRGNWGAGDNSGGGGNLDNRRGDSGGSGSDGSALIFLMKK